MAERWVEEFRAEIADDHRELMDCRAARAATGWDFEHARERTRAFYRERITGFARCNSISRAERDGLLAHVEAMGSDRFPG